MKKLSILITLCIALALCGCAKQTEETKPAEEKKEAVLPEGYKIIQEDAFTLSDGTKLSIMEYDYEAEYAKAGIEYDPDFVYNRVYSYVTPDYETILTYCLESGNVSDDYATLSGDVEKKLLIDFKNEFLNYPIEDYLEKAYKNYTDPSVDLYGSFLTLNMYPGDIIAGVISVTKEVVYNKGYSFADLEEYNGFFSEINTIYADEKLSEAEKEEQLSVLMDRYTEFNERIEENDEIIETAEYKYDIKTGERVK